MNDEKLELNACMLAPTPILTCLPPTVVREEVPYGGDKVEMDHRSAEVKGWSLKTRANWS